MGNIDNYVKSLRASRPSPEVKDIEKEKSVTSYVESLEDHYTPKPESRFATYSSGVGDMFTPKEGDLSEYTPYMDKSRIFTSDPVVLDETRAKAQTNWQVWRNAASQAVIGHMVGGMIENVGYLFNFRGIHDQITKAEHEWGSNWVSNIGASIKKWAMETGTPIHQTQKAQEGGIQAMGDRTWWASHAPSILTSASLIVPVFGLVKGVGALGKALKIGSKWSRLTKTRIETIGSALASRHMYSTTESVDNYNRDYEHAKEVLGFSEEDAKGYASESAATNYRWGYTNLWKDILSWGMLLRYPRMSVRASEAQLSRNLFRNAHTQQGRATIARNMAETATRKTGFKPIHLLYHGILEGVEEFNIQWQKKEGKRAADIKYGYTPDSPYEDLLDRISEHTSDPHTWDSFFWGTMGGLTFGILGRAASGQMFKSNIHREQDYLNKLNAHADMMHTNLRNIIHQSEQGDSLGADLSRATLKTGLVVNSAPEGTLGIDIEMLRNLSNLNDTQLQELGLDRNAANIAGELSKEMQEVGDLYDRMSNKVYGFGDKDAYIVNALFANEVIKKETDNLLSREKSNLEELLQKRKEGQENISELGQTRNTLTQKIKTAEHKVQYLKDQIEGKKKAEGILSEFVDRHKAMGIDPMTAGFYNHKIGEHITELEAALAVAERTVEGLNNQLDNHSKTEQKAVSDGLVSQEQLDNDANVIETLSDAEIEITRQGISMLESQKTQATKDINKLNKKEEQKKLIKEIEERQEHEQKQRDELVEQAINEATTEAEVNKINESHNKFYTKIAKKRIAEIKKADKEAESRKKVQEEKPSEKVEKEADPESQHRPKAEKPAPIQDQVNALEAAFEGVTDPSLQEIKGLAIEIIESEYKISDTNEQKVERLNKLLDEVENLPKIATITAELITKTYYDHLAKVKKAQETQKESGEISEVSDKVVEQLSKLQDLINRRSEGKFHVELGDETNPMIGVLNSLVSNISKYTKLLLDSHITSDNKLDFNTVLSVLSDRGDNSLEQYYMTTFQAFEILKTFSHTDQKLASLINFDSMPTARQVKSSNFINRWYRQHRSGVVDASIQDGEHRKGVYIYLHALQGINPDGVTLRNAVTAEQENLLNILKNIKPGDKVRIVSDPNHVDSRYKTQKEISERNENPNTIPIKIVIERADGTTQDVGFLQELGAVHAGVRYVDTEGNFKHFSYLLQNNDAGLSRVRVLQEHIDVLKQIYRSKKENISGIKIPTELQEVFDELTSINKEQIEKASPDAIKHVVTPIFYGVPSSYLNNYKPTTDRIMDRFKRHYYRFKQDFEINKRIRNNIQDLKLDTEAEVTHKGTPSILFGQTRANLNSSIQPVERKDGRGSRIIMARTPIINPQSGSLIDVATGEAISVMNPHVVTKKGANTGMFTILEHSTGEFYAAPIYHATIENGVSEKYAKQTTDYVNNKMLEILDLLEKGEESQIDLILEDLSKIIRNDQNQYFKINRFGDGTFSLLFATNDKAGLRYYDLRYDTDGKLVLYKSDQITEKGSIVRNNKYQSRVFEASEKNINEILKPVVARMPRSLNLNNDNILDTSKFNEPEGSFVDPVTGIDHGNYFDFLINTSAVTTTIQALVNKKGDIISNFNPNGLVKQTLFIKDLSGKRTSTAQDLHTIDPNSVNSLEEYIDVLPDMNKYSIITAELSELEIDLKIKKESISKTNDFGNPVSAEIINDTIHLYPDMFKKSKSKQASILAHEMLHAIIDNKVNKLSAQDAQILKSKLEGYITRLEKADKKHLSKAEINILNKLINIAKGEPTELITYGFTSPSVANILNKIEFEQVQDVKKSFWSELYDTILELLGIKNSSAIRELTNILTDHLDITESIVRPDATTQQQMLSEIQNNVEQFVDPSVPIKRGYKKGYIITPLMDSQGKKRNAIREEYIKPVKLEALIEKGINEETAIYRSVSGYVVYDTYSGFTFAEGRSTIKAAIEAANESVRDTTRESIIESFDESDAVSPLSKIRNKYTSRSFNRDTQNTPKVDAKNTAMNKEAGVSKEQDQNIESDQSNEIDNKFDDLMNNVDGKRHVDIESHIRDEITVEQFKNIYYDAEFKPIC